MKKITTALTVLLALSLPLMAQEANKPAKKPAVPNTSTSPTEGRVGYVSEKKITVKAKGAEASTAFQVDAETKVTLHGESKTVAEIKKGWIVKATPRSSDVGTAATIEIIKAEVPAKKDPKPESAPSGSNE
ncbi:MAG: hypothetical protein EBZ05_08240 [Verrucomicrobia bacterium]|nr:hypothetical protein [Verrucomicrobiota bacterium]NDA26808.1 hypothetical protein [Verrucomicrobiota bacterium]